MFFFYPLAYNPLAKVKALGRNVNFNNQNYLTDDEINNYLGGIKAAAVAPKGKVATIWGTLKTGF